MRNSILKQALVLIAWVPTFAAAQSQRLENSDAPHRVGSWEFSVGGGLLSLDPALRDFLGSGAPESRFANVPVPGRGVPAAVARVGYSFTSHLGLSVSMGAAMGSGVTYLNPTEAITYTGNINAVTSPFVLVGTELTRISGINDRVTHSTWGWHAGLGVRHMVSENVALRLEGRVQFANYNEVPMAKHSTVAPLIQFGFSYFAGGRERRREHEPMAAAAMPPARVDTIVRTVREGAMPSRQVDTVRIPAPSSVDQVILRVQFRTDSATLLAISGPVLDTVAAAIRETPGSRWQVEGHTDNTGSAAENKALALARAQSVVDYLVSKGVDRSILTAQGFGPDRPVFSNSTDAGRAQNRRVQLRRIPPPPTTRVP